MSVGELLAALGAKTPAPASGAATAVTAAIAAALTQLAAAFAGDDETVARCRAVAARLVQLGDEDAVAYTAFMAQRNDETRAGIIRVPEEIASCADEVAEAAARVRDRLRSSVAGDAEAAVELAHAAARVGRRLAELNRGSGS